MRLFEKLWLSQFDKVIESNITKPDCTIDDLSHQMNLSKSSLHRKMVKLTGTSPYEYLKQKKLEKAHKRLKSKTPDAVSEVARDLGYSDTGYFKKLYEDYWQEKE